MTRQELETLRDELLELKNFNDVLARFPKDTIYNYLVSQNKDHPNDIAINYLGRKYTFAEAINNIDTVADALLHRGINPGEHVCLSPLATPEGIFSFYAINKIGAVAHFINPAMSKQEIIEHVEDCGAKLFLIPDLFFSPEMKSAIEKAGVSEFVLYSLMDSTPIGLNSDTVKNLIATMAKRSANKVKFDENVVSWKTFMKEGRDNPNGYNHPYDPNSPAAVAYTSGTTGVSKAVLQGNDQFNAMPFHVLLSEEEAVERQSGMFNSLPFWIYYSLANGTHEPLCLGITVELDPLFEPKNFVKRFKQYKFNHWNSIPHYIKNIFGRPDVKKLDFSKFKIFTSGGDFLYDEVRTEANETIRGGGGTAVVRNGIGLNETLGGFGYQYGPETPYGGAGRPFVGNRAKVLNVDTGEPCATNEEGELYLCTPTLMMEYYHRPDLTEEAIVYDEEGVRWLKTGDLAKLDERGEIYPGGRIKRIVMTLDETGLPTKLFPEKIKLAMINHEAVESVEAISVDDEKRITIPVMFVILKPGYEDTPELRASLKAFADFTLPTYMVPVETIFLEQFPTKSTMKADLDALENVYYDYIGSSRARAR